MQETLKRKLAAILSADVAGYSRLMDDDEVSTVRTLQAYQKIISDQTEQHNGRVVDSPGDNIMAEFASVVDAVQCAVEIQQNLRIKNGVLPDNRRMEFRIGINLGDVIVEDGRIYGDGVNIAARLENMADPGGICISGRAYDQVENKLDLNFGYLGEHQVKNIRRPIRVYKISDEAPDSVLDSIVDLRVPEDKPSIAVLPFVNMSGDPEQEYFADGLAEELITALSKVPDMLVIASSSMFTYKGKRVKVKQVGKELGVQYVVEGSVRKAGNRIRVKAQLIDAKTEKHIWADRYDRELENIFELQDELTIRILEQLNVRLLYEARESWKVKGTDNLVAYLKYWKGIVCLTQAEKNDVVQARQMFEEVISLDPNWAEGYALLSLSYISDYYGGWSRSPEQCIKKALENAEKAISLDDTLPDPYGVKSTVFLVKGYYDEAIAEAKKAVALQPGHFLSHLLLGTVFIWSGKPKKAQDIYKKAIHLSPKFPLTKMYLGMAYIDSKQYDEAIKYINKALELNPGNLFAYACLTAAYSLSDRQDNAHKQAQEVLKIDPKFSVEKFADRIPYKNQDDKDRILNALRKAGLK